MENNITTYPLTQEQLNLITEVACREAVKQYRAELARDEKKRAREEDKARKTKKMLSSYRRVKRTLSDEAEFTDDEKAEIRWKFVQDLMGNARDLVGKPERAIKDEERRRQEDMYCIYRIEKAVEMYRDECEKAGNEEAKRRFRELSAMYLDENPLSVEEIAEGENIAKKTVYKDLGIACRIVAIYLLGM